LHFALNGLAFKQAWAVSRLTNALPAYGIARSGRGDAIPS
jgi:hypothetical protein